MSQVGPIIAGPMASHTGWRNFWWFNVAVLGLTLVMTIFLFPETKWQRSVQFDSTLANIAVEKVETNGIEEKVSNAAEISRLETADPSVEPSLETTPTAARDPYLGKGKPTKQQWKLFQSNSHPWKSIALDLWLPWKLFAFPIVEFAAFIVSWSCSSFLTINLTQSQAFAAPPYNFSSQTIGGFLINMLYYETPFNAS